LRTDNVVSTNIAAFAQADRGSFVEAGQPGVMAQFGLEPIPFATIGLYRDAYRTQLPESVIAAMRATGAPASVGP
jgi:hypothetical protein